MSNDIEKELQYIKENLDNINEIENSQFISNMLIEELEKQKLENRSVKSIFSYNVGQVYYGSKNLLFTGGFEGEESKNEVEVKTYYKINKILLGILLTGSISIFGVKSGIDFYGIGSSIGNGIYDGVSNLFTLIGEKIKFDYIKDLKEISSQIINDVLPNVSEDIKKMKQFVKSEAHVIESVTNGIINLFGLYINSKSNGIGVVDELLNSNKKLIQQMNKQPVHVKRRLDYINFDCLKKDNIFLAEYLYRFNLMYDVFKNKLNKLNIKTPDFLLDFSVKIFKNKDIYEEILMLNQRSINKKLTDSDTSIFVETNENFYDQDLRYKKNSKFLKQENKFRNLYKEFESYIINIEELKEYKYKQKVELFKNIIEKSQKDNEKKIVESSLQYAILYLSEISHHSLVNQYQNHLGYIEIPEDLLSLKGKFINKIYNIKDSIMEKFREQYSIGFKGSDPQILFKEKQKAILNELKKNNEMIKTQLKNIIKISKINDYASKDNTSHLFEYSELAKNVLLFIKDKKSLDYFIEEDNQLKIAKQLEQSIENEIIKNKDENLITKTLNKKNNIKIEIEDKYYKYQDNILSVNDSFFDLFTTNLYEYLNVESKKVIEKNKKIKEVIKNKKDSEDYGLKSYNKNKFNNNIEKNIYDLSLFVFNYEQREKQDKYIKKINIKRVFSDKYTTESLVDFQIEYLNILLDIAKEKLKISDNNLTLEDKKNIIINFLEQNKKDIFENIDPEIKKYVCLEDSNKLKVKENILELIINDNYERYFTNFKDKNIQLIENNLSNKELLKIFFDLMLFNEETYYLKSSHSPYNNTDLESAFNKILYKFQNINKEDLYLYFESIKQIKEEEFKGHYNDLINSNDVIKDFIDKKISNFEENLRKINNEINTNNYIINKLKNNDYALFDDMNNELFNLIEKEIKENNENNDVDYLKKMIENNEDVNCFEIERNKIKNYFDIKDLPYQEYKPNINDRYFFSEEEKIYEFNNINGNCIDKLFSKSEEEFNKKYEKECQEIKNFIAKKTLVHNNPNIIKRVFNKFKK